MQSCCLKPIRHGVKYFLFSIFIVIVSASIAISATDKSVTNVFDNTFIVDAVRDISAQVEVPIICDATVQGQVTAVLENTPLEQALERVLSPGGYVYVDKGGYYLVGAPDVKNPSYMALCSVKVIRTSHVKASDILRLMPDVYAQYVKSSEASILTITAPPSIMASVMSYITEIDKPLTPTPQVMIEALVIDVTKDGRRELGLDWRWDHVEQPTGLEFRGSGLLEMANLLTNFEYLTLNGLNKFMASLKTSISKGQAKIEANPRIATLSGHPAEIFIGRDRYYPLETSGSSQIMRLESIKTGITLKLLPQIDNNGDITIHVEPEVSDVVTDSNGSGSFPAVSRRRVDTTVRLRSGESVIIGGLVQRVKHTVTTKVPIIGDIPIFGALFSSTKTIDEEGEVLIVLTAYLPDGAETGRKPKLNTEAYQMN